MNAHERVHFRFLHWRGTACSLHMQAALEAVSTPLDSSSRVHACHAMMATSVMRSPALFC
jgi:hypothetical protein